jgi:hypothetical protein
MSFLSRTTLRVMSNKFMSVSEYLRKITTTKCVVSIIGITKNDNVNEY